MRVNGNHHRTIWPASDCIEIIDQRRLPFAFVIEKIRTSAEMSAAIAEMHVRGAPLIGVAAAYGAALAALEIAGECKIVDTLSRPRFETLLAQLQATRPTAVNLAWALDVQRKLVHEGDAWREVYERLMASAATLADDDVACCSAIGDEGVRLLERIAECKSGPVNVLTHCNAGWLATIDWGTATAPIYKAAQRGIRVHVWVDETRPRLQGGKLTAFELAQEGIPHTVIADNTGGHLMQHGMVDICFVGTDRTTRMGDVANKIGTYLKALAARDNGVPFYVCAPSSSIDWSARHGLREIQIEQRAESEVSAVSGVANSAAPSETEVTICNPGSPCCNYGFDVTPARLVTSLITERGVCPASEDGLTGLFPEFAHV